MISYFGPVVARAVVVNFVGMFVDFAYLGTVRVKVNLIPLLPGVGLGVVVVSHNV